MLGSYPVSLRRTAIGLNRNQLFFKKMYYQEISSIYQEDEEMYSLSVRQSKDRGVTLFSKIHNKYSIFTPSSPVCSLCNNLLSPISSHCSSVIPWYNSTLFTVYGKGLPNCLFLPKQFWESLRE